MTNNLIERLKKATEPDRDLDVAIETLQTGNRAHPYLPGVNIDDGYPSGRPYSTPAYTTSLDAAITLVPEGWFTFVANEDRHSYSWGWELRGGFGNSAFGRAPTAALALCIVALHAREPR